MLETPSKAEQEREEYYGSRFFPLHSLSVRTYYWQKLPKESLQGSLGNEVLCISEHSREALGMYLRENRLQQPWKYTCQITDCREHN